MRLDTPQPPLSLAGMGVCRIADKSYYVSFDGHYHAIRSTCAYVLVKTCHFTMDLPFFKISGENEEREGQSPAFYLRQLNISIFDSLITLQKDHHVLVSWVTQAGTKEASSEERALWSFLLLTCPALLCRSMANRSPFLRTTGFGVSGSLPAALTPCSAFTLGWKSSLMATGS